MTRRSHSNSASRRPITTAASRSNGSTGTPRRCRATNAPWRCIRTMPRPRAIAAAYWRGSAVIRTRSTPAIARWRFRPIWRKPIVIAPLRSTGSDAARRRCKAAGEPWRSIRACAQGHGFHASLLIKAGRFAEALQSCDRALALDPANAQTHCDRAVVLAKFARYQEAQEACERALTLDPDHAEAHSNRAYILERLRRYPEAIEACDRAIALSPGLGAGALQSRRCLDEAQPLCRRARKLRSRRRRSIRTSRRCIAIAARHCATRIGSMTPWRVSRRRSRSTRARPTRISISASYGFCAAILPAASRNTNGAGKAGPRFPACANSRSRFGSAPSRSPARPSCCTANRASATPFSFAAMRRWLPRAALASCSKSKPRSSIF